MRILPLRQRNKALVRTLMIGVVIGLSLPGCSYVPQSRLDECQARLAEQQQVIAAQQTQARSLAEQISANHEHLDDIQQQYLNLKGRIQELDVGDTVPLMELKSHVNMRFSPSSTVVCQGDSASWSVALTETKGVGVTFTESVIWYRVREHVRSFPGPFDVTYRNSTTDPLSFPFYVSPYGRVEVRDLGSEACFSEERHYYHVFFGLDNNGNNMVVAGKIIVNKWTPPEDNVPEWHTSE